MKKSLLLIILFLFQLSISQEKNLIEIKINALFLDIDSRKGIPFSEVQFIDKNLGALTNPVGEFSLNYPEKSINKNDIFMITAFGYDTIITNADKLYNFLNMFFETIN